MIEMRVHSTATELPTSCKSAAERMLDALREEDRFADLSKEGQEKLADLEQQLSQESGEKIALVAYRL